jgi:hypothetical protein
MTKLLERKDVKQNRGEYLHIEEMRHTSKGLSVGSD